ncbi:MAG TPA: YetF domain-containing protein [Anaerolineaceae bacterium]|nr:YetF domain-containing protein [Anaerolineaceae bacterium]
MDPTILNDMFVLGIPVLEKILRTVIVYIALLIGLRIAGKREMAQLNPFDLVVLLTISNTVQNAIIGNDTSVTGGIIGVAALLSINYLFVRLTYSNQKIEAIVEGTEDVLIDHGQLMNSVLEREAITPTELEIAAHKQGFSSLAEVERAVLEPEGGVSFIARKPEPEETRHQELITRLDQMSAEISVLRGELEDLKAK